MRVVRTEQKKRSKNLDVRMPSLPDEEWDRKWKNSQSALIRRYRTRVMLKGSDRVKGLSLRVNPEE